MRPSCPAPEPPAARRRETARAALRLIAGDKQRHALFAWVWLGARMGDLDAAARATVGRVAGEMLEHVILTGYRNTWLLPASLARDRLREAEARTAAAGLGASTVAQEKSAVRATLGQVRERLAVWDVVLPAASHPEPPGRVSRGCR